MLSLNRTRPPSDSQFCFASLPGSSRKRLLLKEGDLGADRGMPGPAKVAVIFYPYQVKFLLVMGNSHREEQKSCVVYIHCQSLSQLLCNLAGNLCLLQSKFWSASMGFVQSRAQLICPCFLTGLVKPRCLPTYFYLYNVLKRTDVTKIFQLQDFHRTFLFWVGLNFLNVYYCKASGEYLFYIHMLLFSTYTMVLD